MKTINQTLLAGAIAAVLAVPAFATNGTNMTGVGAQSVAMGGTGVAAYYGAENVIVNPAMIGKGTGTEFAFGGTLFKPNVSNDGIMGGGSFATSAGDTYVIPSVSLSSRISNSLSFGIGMYGTSGMGVDYKNKTANTAGDLMNAQSNLQIMRIVPTIAYNTSNSGVGASAIIQYGALDINYNNPMKAGANTGSGMSSDLGMGFSLGGYYDITKQFTAAVSYTSAISMKYKDQLNSATGAASGFMNVPVGGGATMDVMPGITDTLEQPAEVKLGAAYTMGNIMLTGDFKQIRWGDAKGYKDFGWEDQNVISLGLKYSGKGYWVGAGYNKADNPIKQKAGSTPNGAALNMFNNVFFPAITEQHFSVGAGYDVTKSVSIEGAAMFAPEVNVKADTAAFAGFGMSPTNTTKHSQTAFTVQAKYKF